MWTKKMSRVLFTDAVSETQVQRLRDVGFEVVVDASIDYDALIQDISLYDVLVVRSRFPVDRRMLDCAVRLRCVGRVGAGMEIIDVAYAESRGIRCFNSPEGNRDAVGEHTMGLLLTLFNRIARADAEVRGGLWQREANRGMEVMGKTVGIVGFGNMGGAFARRLAGFDCQVLAYDLLGSKASGFSLQLPYVREASLQDLWQQCDVVSLHVPLDMSTRHFVNSEFLGRFVHPIALINTSRGAVVDTIALAESLRKGVVSGVALDVFECENMERDALQSACQSETDDTKSVFAAWEYLKQSQYTVLTPHVAGWTVESKERLVATLIDKIIDFITS